MLILDRLGKVYSDVIFKSFTGVLAIQNLCGFIKRYKSSTQKTSMSELQFTQHANPVSGKLEWVAESKDEHDYIRDVARSSYADMLHDTERNQMYYKAIRIAIQSMHNSGKKANVLDIGTGTGLLSMMAATAGADSITAIEVFAPMAMVARMVTKANGFEFIKVINKHSTEVVLGVGGDMKERANILITELFDTELIGEGALEAYQHAHMNLMEEDCIAVPHSATTYMQIVQSDIMSSWHALKPIKVVNQLGKVTFIEPDPSMSNCPGVPAVHDIQLSQVAETEFTQLTDAVEVFDFQWGSRSLTSKPRQTSLEVKAVRSGRAQIVLSWWTLNMDSNGEIILSTAPKWYHPNPQDLQWRDHWLQSVYFLPKEFDVCAGEIIFTMACHDAYSMWFDAGLKKAEFPNTSGRPICEYLPRMLWSRPRLGMLNDQERNETFAKALNKLKIGKSAEDIAVCVSDASLVPLLVARTCFSKGHVYSLETDVIGRRGLQNLIKHNYLKDSITIIDHFIPNELRFKNRRINLLVGEPFFTSSFLPWHNLRFWYLRTELRDSLAPDAQIMPNGAYLHIAAVQFDDLWKIRAPVSTVEGFDVTLMDDMITKAMEVQEYHEPEPHALWEYPCTLVSDVQSVMSFDFTSCVPNNNIDSVGSLTLLNHSQNHLKPTVCHGVVLWMSYNLDEENILNTGLLNCHKFYPEWNKHNKQGVFFLRNPIKLQNKKQKIDFKITFISSSGEMKMKFTE